MSSDFDLSGLKPNQDIFDYVSEYLRDKIYSRPSNAFYAQSYLVAALLAVFVCCTIVLCHVNWRAGRFRVLEIDGAATRPSLSFVVPVLWSAHASLLMVLPFWLKTTNDGPFSIGPVGFFWWCTPFPLFSSYALATINVVASAPACRRLLIRLNGESPWRQRYFLSICFLVLCGAIVAAIMPGAVTSRRVSDDMYILYLNLQGIVAAAKAKNDVSALVQLADLTGDLERVGHAVMRQARITCGIYVALCLGFIVAAVLPALALNRFVTSKMSRLDFSKGTRTGSSGGVMSGGGMLLNSTSPAAPAYKVQLLADPCSAAQISHDLLKLNKDRPFGNTIALETPLLPPQFQEVFDAKTQSTEERIILLRRRLREENQHLGAYLVLLLLLSSYTMFVAFGGPLTMGSEAFLPVLFCWQTWSFIIVAYTLTAFVARDTFKAYRFRGQQPSPDLDLPTLSIRSHPAGLTGITMTQEIALAQEAFPESPIAEKDIKMRFS